MAPLSITTLTVFANRAHIIGDKCANAAWAEPIYKGSKLESDPEGEPGGTSSGWKETRLGLGSAGGTVTEHRAGETVARLAAGVAEVRRVQEACRDEAEGRDDCTIGVGVVDMVHV